MRWQHILFDLDGTLLDTSEGIRKSVVRTLEELSLPALPEETIRTFVGPPINRSLQQTFHLSDADTAHATEVFRNFYKNEYLLYAQPYPGIYELLDSLHAAGAKLAVATYKRDDYAKQLLAHYDMTQRFDFIRGCDQESKFTKTDIVKLALAGIGCTEDKKAILVGDTVHDLGSAVECGLDFAAVTYGFGFTKENPPTEEAVVICADTVPQLEAILQA